MSAEVAALNCKGVAIAAKTPSPKAPAACGKPDLGFFDTSKEDIITIIKTVFKKQDITADQVNKLVSLLKASIQRRNTAEQGAGNGCGLYRNCNNRLRR